LRASPDVEEVILSGGDPLTLSSARLAELITALDDIDTLATLRVHTRFPVVLPSRVTSGLLRLLERTRLRTVVVVHSNHANEISEPTVTDALRALSESSDHLLNQSVLLHGVNDSVAALRELSEALFAANVMPYYVHMLDRVSGSAHFDVAFARAHSLVRQLRNELPGYLVPRLVREDPGALSKTTLY
jgi:KamA family protein